MSKKQKKKSAPASGDVVTNRRAPPRRGRPHPRPPPQIRVGGEAGGGDRPAGLGGKGAAQRPGADDRRLRRRRRGRGFAPKAPYPSLRVLGSRRPRRRAAAEAALAQGGDRAPGRENCAERSDPDSN